MARRVAITGMGVVSSIGLGRSAFAAGLRKGQTGHTSITRFKTENFPVRYAHEVRNFPLPQKARDLTIEYALSAATEAVTDANVDFAALDPFRVAVSVSSSKGGMETLTDLLESKNEKYFPARAASKFSDFFPSAPAVAIAKKFETRGPLKSWIGACATGNMAVADAFFMIERGDADYAIAGASDASLVPLLLAGYSAMKVLSADRMRPFDCERDGFLAGEGAAVFFVESVESAKARGAKIYAEIAAPAMGQETSHALLFSDEEATLSRTITLALQRAGETARSLDYVNLHGTATLHGDLYETREIKKAFGAHAASISLSSTKPMTGHLLGASGAVEIAATLAAMDGGFIPPTIGLVNPATECDLNYTAGQAVEKQVNVAMSISMGFGGQTSAIVLRKI